MQVREEALKALEGARQKKDIGSALEAKVRISVSEPLFGTIQGRERELREVLIVSGVEIVRAGATNGSGALHVDVLRAEGQKCERCWNYSEHVGENKEYPTICERCSGALREMGR